MLTEFLNLGRQPIANGFLNPQNLPEREFLYNLRIGFDENTGIVSQMSTVKPEMMFNERYPYRCGLSKTMVKHFSDFSRSLRKHFNNNKLKILEIGSNDGTFLKSWNTNEAIGIEPCKNFCKETNNLGYTTYDDFWTQETADKVINNHGKFDIIFSANCMCHIENLDEVFSAVSSSLSKKGLFIFEDPSLKCTIQNNSYDQFYDEHVHLFSVYSLSNILRDHGLKIVKVDNLAKDLQK